MYDSTLQRQQHFNLVNKETQVYICGLNLVKNRKLTNLTNNIQYTYF